MAFFLLRGDGCRVGVDQGGAKVSREAGDEPRCAVEAGGRIAPFVEVGGSANLQLQRVPSLIGAPVTFDDEAARKRLVEGDDPAFCTGNGRGIPTDPVGGRRAMPVADHQLRLAAARRHGMAIQKQGLSAPDREGVQRMLDGTMIGGVRLGNSRVQVVGAQWPFPKVSMEGGSVGNDAQPTAGSTGGSGKNPSSDDRGIDIVRCAVAVDGRARRLGDDRAVACGDRSSGQPIDLRIAERRQCVTPAHCLLDQPAREIATAMRNRQQDRQGRRVRHYSGWGKGCPVHGYGLAVPEGDSKKCAHGPAGKCRAFKA